METSAEKKPQKKKLERKPGAFEKASETLIAAIPVRFISIDKIVPPKKHDRSDYDKEALKVLAKNIKEQGLLHPIVVRKLPDGTFERVAGFRRLLATKLNGETEILSRIIDADDLAAKKAMLSENTEREPLNAYDKAVFFEEIIWAVLNDSDLPALHDLDTTAIRARINRMRNMKNNRIGGLPTAEDVEFAAVMEREILSEYGFGIDSFAEFMRIIDFHADIVEAVKSKQIDRSVAAEINRLNSKASEHLIAGALLRAISENMTKKEAADMVAGMLKTEKPATSNVSVKQIEKTVGIKSFPKDQQQKVAEIIKKFVEDLDAVRGSSGTQVVE